MCIHTLVYIWCICSDLEHKEPIYIITLCQLLTKMDETQINRPSQVGVVPDRILLLAMSPVLLQLQTKLSQQNKGDV